MCERTIARMVVHPRIPYDCHQLRLNRRSGAAYLLLQYTHALPDDRFIRFFLAESSADDLFRLACPLLPLPPFRLELPAPAPFMLYISGLRSSVQLPDASKPGRLIVQRWL